MVPGGLALWVSIMGKAEMEGLQNTALLFLFQLLQAFHELAGVLTQWLRPRSVLPHW